MLLDTATFQMGCIPQTHPMGELGGASRVFLSISTCAKRGSLASLPLPSQFEENIIDICLELLDKSLHFQIDLLFILQPKQSLYKEILMMLFPC